MPYGVFMVSKRSIVAMSDVLCMPIMILIWPDLLEDREGNA
jgi:hypothetical protein